MQTLKKRLLRLDDLLQFAWLREEYIFANAILTEQRNILRVLKSL